MARFAAYFAAFVQQRETTLQRSRQTLAELASERLNIAEAWDWAAAQGQTELLDRMRPGLQRFQQLSAPQAPLMAFGAPVLRGWAAPAEGAAGTGGGAPRLVPELTAAAP
jgi:hypothetical protein